MSAGIYEIRHLPSGRAYIGSALDLDIRLRAHRLRLARGRHPCTALQADWVRDGASAFRLAPLREAAPDERALQEAEQATLDAEERPYNRMPAHRWRPLTRTPADPSLLVADLYAAARGAGREAAIERALAALSATARRLDRVVERLG